MFSFIGNFLSILLNILYFASYIKLVKKDYTKIMHKNEVLILLNKVTIWALLNIILSIMMHMLNWQF